MLPTISSHATDGIEPCYRRHRAMLPMASSHATDGIEPYYRRHRAMLPMAEGVLLGPKVPMADAAPIPRDCPVYLKPHFLFFFLTITQTGYTHEITRLTFLFPHAITQTGYRLKITQLTFFFFSYQNTSQV